MKIGFVSHSGQRYGASRSLLDLVTGLRLHGCGAHVFLPFDGPFSAMLKAVDVPFSIVPIPRWLAGDEPMPTLRALESEVQELQPLLRAARAAGLDAMHTNSLVTPAGALVARALGLPHVWHVREFGDLDYALRWTIDRATAMTFVRDSGPVICVSDAVRRHHFGVSPAPSVHRVHNGVFPRARMASGVRRGSGPDGQVARFAVVGRVMPQKAQHLAIEALALARAVIPDLQLVVVGEGRCGYAKDLRITVDRLGLEGAVSFAGEIEDRDFIYSGCDAVLVCSVMEALGRVAAEAMARGLPVIARDTGGSPELIDHGVCGLLFDGTAEGLARQMLALCQNRALADALAAGGLERARGRFTTERCSAAIARLHRERQSPGAEWNEGRHGLTHIR